MINREECAYSTIITLLFLAAVFFAPAAQAFDWQRAETNRHLGNIEDTLDKIEHERRRPLPFWTSDNQGRAEAERARAAARYYNALTNTLKGSQKQPSTVSEFLWGTQRALPPSCQTETHTLSGMICTTCCDAFRCATECAPRGDHR